LCEFIECGRHFQPSRSDQRFCSHSHRAAEHRRRQRDGEVDGLAEYRAKREAGLWPDPHADYNTTFWAYLSGDPGVEKRVLSKSGSGGFLAPSDFADRVVSARRMQSPFELLATTFATDKGGNMPVPLTSTSLADAVWIPESSSYSSSGQDVTFAQVTLGAYKLTAAVSASEELVADSGPDLEDYLVQEFGDRLAAAQGAAFIQGNGSDRPLGIAASTSFTATTAASGSTTTFTAQDCQAFLLSVPKQYRDNSVWIMHSDILTRMTAAVGSGGAPIFPELRAEPQRLLGRPVFPADFGTLSTSTRAGWVGDLRRAYVVRQVRGLAVLRAGELNSDSGLVTYRVFTRVHGRPAIQDAGRVLVTAAS
jgi:HK97 family phage major capsid protein